MAQKQIGAERERSEEEGVSRREVVPVVERPDLAEANKPSIEDVDLERPLDPRTEQSISLETESRQEYFRYLQGSSRYEREIHAMLRAERDARGNMEQILLRIIESLLRAKSSRTT